LKSLPNTLIAGANVQEEVGFEVLKEQFIQFSQINFFAVDCSAADDLTGD